MPVAVKIVAKAATSTRRLRDVIFGLLLFMTAGAASRGTSSHHTRGGRNSVEIKSMRAGLILSFLSITLLSLAGNAAAQNYRYGVHSYYLSPYLADKTSDLGSGFVRIQIDWDALQPNS